jgi:hypothetical protein
MNSCSPNPRKFNDELMKSLSGADMEYTSFYSAIDQIPENKNYSGLLKKRKEVLKGLDKYTEKINNLQVPEGGEEFKKSCIDYLEIMKNSLNGFVAEGKSLTENQLDKAMENLGSNEEKLNKLNDKIIEIQKVFSEKKNFKLEYK